MIVEPNSNMLKMTPSTDADMQAPPSYDIVMASSGPFVPGGASKADNVKVPYQGPSSGTAGPASQTPAMPATTVYNYYNPVTHEHVASLLPPDHPQMICLQRGGHVPHTRYGVLGILAAVFWFPLGISCCLLDRKVTCEQCGMLLDNGFCS